MSSHLPQPLISKRCKALKGEITPPGDKSISHRALIFGLLSVGETTVEGLLEGDDVLRTADACRAVGATITREAMASKESLWRIQGVGIGGLKQPDHILDFGNAGTGSRLMMGVAGSHPIRTTFDGDASLRNRPMGRILDPLILMGIRVVDQQPAGRVPITLQGPSETIPIEYTSPVASAQIKSAILLAGLNSAGTTTVIEHEASRDHTERMLTYFGAKVTVEPFGEAGRRITLQGHPELSPRPIIVPADPSSAAFALVAALIVEGSDIIIQGVMMNPLRTGLITTLLEMGASIETRNEREQGGETVADLRIRASKLSGVDVPAHRAPSMIDEYPILAVAASFATGTTRMRGLSELRVKESDRLAAVEKGLCINGVQAHVDGDDLVVTGSDHVKGGGTVKTHLDHRIAMAFLVMGMASTIPVCVDDGAMIATSYPAFIDDMTRLGADIEA